ncbi:MAG: nucleoside triphosphate pyrophosphohydrolase [Abitibacteriaceae bacterium]|nr:nucleoside triphosphate pyrophosphohydrolase [Abditibacteriaceae bacterium]
MSQRPTPTAAFDRLVQIIARLRAPDGCPWDREQTHATLRTHLLEETYETMEAIEKADDDNLREELGDLLMQPILHAQIAAEESRFDIVDVLESISDKLVRRHPHVFGTVEVANSDEVLQNWDAIKRAEKAAKAEKAAQTADSQTTANAAPDAADNFTSILDDVPQALPALMLALKISKKAAKVGFEWPDMAAVMDKLHEETAELEADLHNQERAAEELGDLLFTVVNVARWKGVNPELTLRDAVTRFTSRFQAMERQANQQELDLESLTPEQWESLWASAKAVERGA